MAFEAVAPAQAAQRRAAPSPVARVAAATALLLLCAAMVAVVGSGSGAQRVSTKWRARAAAACGGQGLLLLPTVLAAQKFKRQSAFMPTHRLRTQGRLCCLPPRRFLRTPLTSP